MKAIRLLIAAIPGPDPMLSKGRPRKASHRLKLSPLSMKKHQLLAALCAGALALSACSETGERINNASSVSEMATNDTAVVYNNNRPWDAASYEREPVIDEPGLRSYAVELRGSEARNVYAMEQDVLFDTDKAKLRAAADEKLTKVSESIRSRMKDGKVQIQVYGHTDSRAGKAYNKELGRDRAQAVADWLMKNGKFDASKITVESKGQTEPAATNETAAGRQENRRVEIVVIQS